MRLARLPLTALLLFTLAFLALPRPAACIDGRTQASQLLRESYWSARNLSPEDRLDFLARLSRTAASLLHEDTERWANELFDLSSSPSLRVTDWTRLTAKKNALVSLAAVHPEKALERFSSISSQPHPADRRGRYPEDLRADASLQIFPAAWRKLHEQSLPSIADESTRIGASGEYPYRSVGLIIEGLGKMDDPKAMNAATSLFSDALKFYPPKLPFANANEEWLALLNSAQNIVSRDVYGQGLQTFVEHLTAHGPLDSPSAAQGEYQADVYTANAVFRFADRDRYMLFRVLPLVARFDSSWAEKLKKDFKELSYATDEIQHVEQGIINGTSTQALHEQLGKQMVDSAALARIQFLQQENPWAALELAKGIGTPDQRVLGLSYVVPGMANVDPVQARKILSQELQLMDGMGTAATLSSSIALAKTAYYLNDFNTFTDSTLKAFEDGATLFTGNSKDRSIERAGFEELHDLVEFSTEHGAYWMVDRVRHLNDPLLRSYLMIFAAEGAAKQRPSEPPVENQMGTVRAAANSAK